MSGGGSLELVEDDTVAELAPVTVFALGAGGGGGGGGAAGGPGGPPVELRASGTMGGGCGPPWFIIRGGGTGALKFIIAGGHGGADGAMGG